MSERNGMKTIYGRLTKRAQKLGLHEMAKELEKTKEENNFDYYKFIDHCRALGINPILALSDSYKEPKTGFTLGGSKEEVTMMKILEELIFILESKGLLKETKIKEANVIEEAKKYDTVFDFAKANNVYLIYLKSKAPVEGIFLYTEKYLMIGLKKTTFEDMQVVLAHEIAHYLLKHENLKPDTKEQIKSQDKKELEANELAMKLIQNRRIPNHKDITNYALNKLLRERKEELLYADGKLGSFYRETREYIWEL